MTINDPAASGSRTGGAPTRCADVAEMQAIGSSILVPIHVAAPRETRFAATVEPGAAGPITLARLRSTSHTVHRGRGDMTSGDRDLFKAILHLSGDLAVAQDDRRARVRPGGLVLVDTTRPYTLEVSTRCDVIAIGIPRGMLGAGAEVVAGRTALPVSLDTGTRRLIACFLQSLGGHRFDLSGAGGRHFGHGVVSLLAAAFLDESPERAGVTGDLADRILAYAQANLDAPDLSVASVARAHGISARHLHKLCASRGLTFAAWVRRERLSRIHRDLLDPALAQCSVAAIAARWGLYDPSNLGRLLKAEFGRTALEIRRSARAAGSGADASPVRPGH